MTLASVMQERMLLAPLFHAAAVTFLEGTMLIKGDKWHAEGK